MTTGNNCGIIDIKELSKTQLNFLIFCKNFGWGKLEVTIKDGEPAMVTPINQDFKMTEL